MHCCYTHMRIAWSLLFLTTVGGGGMRGCQVIAIFGILEKSYQLFSSGACTQTLMYKETNKNLFYLKKTIFISQNQKFVRQEKEVQKKQKVNSLMSPVSPVFHTEVGLKNVLRVGTSIPYFSHRVRYIDVTSFSSI